MDAKKPRNSSLTSFPNLKARKKQNLNPGKVKILDFHLGKRGIIMKTWGPRSDHYPPSTFDDRMKGSSEGVDGPGWLAEPGLGGLGGK